MNELGDVKEIKLLDLYNKYERFCVSRGYKQLGYRNFKKAIESAYGVTLRTEREGLFVTVNDLPF
jgi:hypothetical protein